MIKGFKEYLKKQDWKIVVASLFVCLMFLFFVNYIEYLIFDRDLIKRMTESFFTATLGSPIILFLHYSIEEISRKIAKKTLK